MNYSLRLGRRKMGRGQKTCKGCGAATGPRAFKCAKCGQAFSFKAESVLGATRGIQQPEKVCDWKSLQRGDRIKVIAGSGPYWPAKADVEGAENIHMGYYGKFTVKSIHKDGIIACGNKKEGAWATCFIYMAEPKQAESGIMRVAHKVVKLTPKVKRTKS
jgi:hypothetical protein